VIEVSDWPMASLKALGRDDAAPGGKKAITLFDCTDFLHLYYQSHPALLQGALLISVSVCDELLSTSHPAPQNITHGPCL